MTVINFDVSHQHIQNMQYLNPLEGRKPETCRVGTTPLRGMRECLYYTEYLSPSRRLSDRAGGAGGSTRMDPPAGRSLLPSTPPPMAMQTVLPNRKICISPLHMNKMKTSRPKKPSPNEGEGAAKPG